jgi:hypothetical protein
LPCTLFHAAYVGKFADSVEEKEKVMVMTCKVKLHFSRNEGGHKFENVSQSKGTVENGEKKVHIKAER